MEFTHEQISEIISEITNDSVSKNAKISIAFSIFLCNL